MDYVKSRRAVRYVPKLRGHGSIWSNQYIFSMEKTHKQKSRWHFCHLFWKTHTLNGVSLVLILTVDIIVLKHQHMVNKLTHRPPHWRQYVSNPPLVLKDCRFVIFLNMKWIKAVNQDRCSLFVRKSNRALEPAVQFKLFIFRLHLVQLYLHCFTCEMITIAIIKQTLLSRVTFNKCIWPPKEHSQIVSESLLCFQISITEVSVSHGT